MLIRYDMTYLLWNEPSIGFSRCLILYTGQIKWPGNRPRNTENAFSMAPALLGTTHCHCVSVEPGVLDRHSSKEHFHKFPFIFHRRTQQLGVRRLVQVSAKGGRNRVTDIGKCTLENDPTRSFIYPSTRRAS